MDLGASAGDGHITKLGYDTVTSVVDDLVAGTRDGDAMEGLNPLFLIVANLHILQDEPSLAFHNHDARPAVILYDTV